MNEKFAAWAMRPMFQSSKIISWGPCNLIAVAYEQIVQIFQYKNHNLVPFRTIPKHRSNITCLSWNIPSVEVDTPQSFSVLLAIGDETGNCLIYTVFSGERHSGISPEANQSISILDIKWSTLDNGLLLLLTSQPSVICMKITPTRTDELKPLVLNGSKFQSINIDVKWSSPLKNNYHYILIDPYDPRNVILASANWLYLMVKLTLDGCLENVSTPAKFMDASDKEKLVGCHYFPFSPNKLVLIGGEGIFLYDLFIRENSLIIAEYLGDFADCVSPFSHARPDRMWVIKRDGAVSRMCLKDDEWDVLSSVATGMMNICGGCVNPIEPSEVVVLAPNGALIVLSEIKDRVLATAMVPGNGENVVSWVTNKDGLVVLSNSGMLCVHQQIRLRFKINDAMIKDVAVIDDTHVAVEGDKLHIIDLVSRSIRTMNIKAAKMKCANGVLAYLSAPNVMEFMTLSGHVLAQKFRDATVKLFTPSESGKWAVFLDNYRVVTLDCASNEQVHVDVDNTIGMVVDMAYVQDAVFLATSRGTLCRVNVKQKTTCVLETLTSIALESVCAYKDTLIVTDTAGCCYAATSETSVPCPYRVKRCRVVADGRCIIQTGKCVFRLLQFPAFTPYPPVSSGDETFRERFFKSKSLKDMERIARELADLKFLNFLYTLENRGTGIPLPAFYSIPKEQFLANQHCTIVCCRVNPKYANDYIEHLILTHKPDKAAEVILENVNKHNILLAYACLNPNEEAVRKIMSMIDSKGSERILSLLLCLAGNNDASVSMVIKGNDAMASLKYIKMLLTETESIDYMKKVKGVANNPNTLVFMRDFNACVSILLKQRQFSKVMAILLHAKQHGIDLEKLEDAQLAVSQYFTD